MSKVSEVVICAAKYLGLTELVAAINADGTLSGERLTERNDLLRCVNIAAADIALSATAPVNSKICRAVSGSIFYSAIDDKLLEIETVKTTAGKTAEYTVYSDRILTEDGTYYVYYTYVPQKCSRTTICRFRRRSTSARLCTVRARNTAWLRA